MRTLAHLRERPRLAWGLLALLMLVLALNAGRIVTAEQSTSLFSTYSRSDFDDYFLAGRGLLAGRDVYRTTTLEELRRRYRPEDLQRPEVLLEIAKELRGVGTYLYPPLLAFLLTPLAGLSYGWAAAIFQLLSMAALFGFAWFLIRRRVVAVQDRPLFLLLLVLLLFEFLRGNLANGNIGFFLILLCSVGLVLAFRESPRAALVGGALLGIATVLKVTPVFFGLVLLAGLRYWALGGAVLGGLLGLAVPALLLGWEANAQLLVGWYGFVIGNFGEAVIVRPWANNQTVSAALGKLFLPHSDAGQAAVGLPWVELHGAAARPFLLGAARGLNLLLYAGAGGAAVLLAVRNLKRGIPARAQAAANSPEAGGAALALLFGVLLASLVGSGVSWYHAYCLLAVPVAWRLALALRGEGLAGPERAFFAVLFIFGVAEPLLPKFLRQALALYSVFAWAMFGFTIWFLRHALRRRGV